MSDVALIDLNAQRANHSVPILSSMIEAAGGRVVRFEPRVEGGLPGPRFAAYLLTGGPGSPLEDAPWRAQLVSAIRQWRQPSMGVCMGFQMLAQAHGWPVQALPQPRLGVYPLRRTEAGRHDPLLHSLPEDAVAFEQRRFGVFAPALVQQRVLARGDAGDVIAARLAPHAAGVIFHPEADPHLVARLWSEDSPVRRAVLEQHGPARLAEMGALIPQLGAVFHTILPGFLRGALQC